MARIRELTQKDIVSAVEILSASEPWTQMAEDQENLQKLLHAALGRGLVYVAEDDSGLAGVVYFVPEPIFAHGGYVRFLAVRPDTRRRGIGRQLMGFVERKIFSQASNIYMSFSLSNEPARKFSEKLGYVKIGEVPDLLTHGDLEWILRKTSNSDSSGRSPRRAQPSIPQGKPTAPVTKTPKAHKSVPRHSEKS